MHGKKLPVLDFKSKKKGEICHLLSSIVMCLVCHARKYLVLFTEGFVLSHVGCFILIFVHGA